MHPGIAGWVLVPIAPHTLSNRRSWCPTTADPSPSRSSPAATRLNFDMQSLASLLHGDRIRAALGAPRALPAPARLELLRRRCGASCAGTRAWPERIGACCDACPCAISSSSPSSRSSWAASSVLTGETGAGKSILIDALQLALGSRGDAGVVREGAARAEIGAEFDQPIARGLARRAGFRGDADDRRHGCCCAARSTRRARAAPGSTAAATVAQLREVAERWSTSTASTPGRGPDAAPRCVPCSMPQAGVAPRRSRAWQAWRAGRWKARRRADRSPRTRAPGLADRRARQTRARPRAVGRARRRALPLALAHAQALMDAARAQPRRQSPKPAAAAHLVGSRARRAGRRDGLRRRIWPAVIDVLGRAGAAAGRGARCRHYHLPAAPNPTRSSACRGSTTPVGLDVLARRYRRAPAELPALLAQWRGATARPDAATDLDGAAGARRRGQGRLPHRGGKVWSSAKAAPSWPPR